MHAGRRWGWRLGLLAALAVAAGCQRGGPEGAPFEPYLVVWAGDADRKDSDFLAVVGANPRSRSYGTVLATVPVRSRGNEPQDLNETFRYDGRVFASATLSNRVFTFDLRDPEAPKLVATTDLTGRRYWAPRAIVSLPNGRVAVACPDRARHVGFARELTGAPGGLVELDANGRLVREVSAGSEESRGYVVAPAGATIARGANVLVTTNQGHGFGATARGEIVPGITVQTWKVPQLSLRRTVLLDAGPRGEENLGPGVPRGMRKRPFVYVNTYQGGALYVSDSIGMVEPAFRLAFDFGAESYPGGAAVTPDDRFYVTALAGRHQVVALDLSDPFAPRRASTVRLDRDPGGDGGGRSRPGGPSALAMSSDGGRIAVADYTIDVPALRRDGDRRLYMLRLDGETGELRVDTAFRDELTDEVGVDFNRTKWPHGTTGAARPRGLLFVAEPPAPE